MPQQLTLRTRRGCTLEELGRFYREATQDFNIPERTKLRVRAEGDGEDAVYFFSVTIDEKARTVKVKKRKTKKEREIEAAVKEQIEQHKKDVKEGKQIAHVPPVKGTVKRKIKKRRKKVEEEQTVEQAIQEIQDTIPADESRPAKKKKRKIITTAYKTEKMENSK